MYRRIARFAIIIPALLLAACGAPKPATVAVDDGVLQTDVITFPMPTGGTVEVQGHGEERFLAVGALEGLTKDRPANGVATMHVFEDSATIVGIQLNIAVPDDGFFYEAWAAKSDGVPAVSLGHLQNPFNDVRHSQRFEQNIDLEPYSMVIVTLEPDDGVPTPSTVIAAKGVLKAHTR